MVKNDPLRLVFITEALSLAVFYRASVMEPEVIGTCGPSTRHRRDPAAVSHATLPAHRTVVGEQRANRRESASRGRRLGLPCVCVIARQLSLTQAGRRVRNRRAKQALDACAAALESGSTDGQPWLPARVRWLVTTRGPNLIRGSMRSVRSGTRWPLLSGRRSTDSTRRPRRCALTWDGAMICAPRALL